MLAVNYYGSALAVTEYLLIAWIQSPPGSDGKAYLLVPRDPVIFNRQGASEK